MDPRSAHVQLTATSRRIVPDTRRRDLLVATGAGLAVLAFVLYAIFALGRQANSSGGVEGIIAAKEFVAQPETQVTVGKDGVSSRQIAGEYILCVRVPGPRNQVYRVEVDAVDYAARRVGDRHYFLLPRP